MTTCLLCLESTAKSKSLKISHEIHKSYTIKNSIEEYIRCSKTIFEYQLTSICVSCFESLKSFHNFATKVNNLHTKESKSEISLSNSKFEQFSYENIENTEEHLIDDLIEYDEEESVDLEEHGMHEGHALTESENLEYLDDCDRIESVKYEENFGEIQRIGTDNPGSVPDSKIPQSCVKFATNLENLGSQNSASKFQVIPNSPIRITLPKNVIKISKGNFKIFNISNIQNIDKSNSESHVTSDLSKVSSQNSNFPPNSFMESNKVAANSKIFQGNEDFDLKFHFGTQNSSEIDNSPKIENSNQKFLPRNRKNHQKYSISTHKPQKIHSCKVCSKNFKTKAILRTHIQKIHSDSQEPSICKECGKVYTNKYILKTHMRKHIVDAEKTYECYICKKTSKNLPHLIDHFKYKHDPAYSTSSVCHICSKTVTRLDIHVKQMHPSDPVERVKCEICGHFMKKSSLKGHLAGHNETGFNCEVCGKFLKNKNSFLCHMKRVHTTGKYKCEHCDKAFHQENRLMDHVACQHTGVFLYKCRVADCEKKFRNAGRRRMHERRMHPQDYEKNFRASYLRQNLENL